MSVDWLRTAGCWTLWIYCMCTVVGKWLNFAEHRACMLSSVDGWKLLRDVSSKYPSNFHFSGCVYVWSLLSARKSLLSHVCRWVSKFCMLCCWPVVLLNMFKVFVVICPCSAFKAQILLVGCLEEFIGCKAYTRQPTGCYRCFQMSSGHLFYRLHPSLQCQSTTGMTKHWLSIFNACYVTYS